MAFPRKLLNDGEEVALEVHPHWLFIAGPMLVALLVVAATVALVVEVNVPQWGLIALLAAIGLSLIFLAGRYVRWTSTNLVVTNYRVIFRTGMVARHAREIPLDRVNDSSVRQSFIERLFGAGRVMIESAGDYGQDPFPQVAHPQVVLNAIQNQIELASRVGRDRAAGVATLSIPEQIEKLDELCRRGIISQQEFEEKKSDLLRRM